MGHKYGFGIDDGAATSTRYPFAKSLRRISAKVCQVLIAFHGEPHLKSLQVPAFKSIASPQKKTTVLPELHLRVLCLAKP